MTFVPWEKYNICKLYALPRTSCKARPCRYNHPPQEELWRIWDFHDESRPNRAQDGRDVSDGYGRPHSRDFEESRDQPPTMGHSGGSGKGSSSLRPPSSASMNFGIHPSRARMMPPQAHLPDPSPAMAVAEGDMNSYRQQRFERSKEPALERRGRWTPHPAHTDELIATGVAAARAKDSYRPIPATIERRAETGYETSRSPRLTPADSTPSRHEREAAQALRSGHIPPDLSGRAPVADSAPPERKPAAERWADCRPVMEERIEASERKPASERWAPQRPSEGERSEPLIPTAGPYKPPPTQTLRRAPPDQHFNPAFSSNDFINGASIYRFMWGNPLCVRCGSMGHLPKGGFCKNEPLSVPEQDYLYRLMRAEQARSKQERPKLLPQQMHSEPSSRELSVEPQSLWQRPTSYPDDREPSYQLQSGSREPGQSSYWQRYREQKDNSLPQRDEDDMTGFWESAPVQTGHKRNFNDFSDFLDGTRDDTRSTAPSRPDGEVKIRGMSQAKQEASVRVEVQVKVDPSTALAPIALTTNFVHPSRAALVASSLRTAPPLPEASVPLDTSDSVTMGATKRMSNGEAKIIGPHPSTIRVSASYITQAAIDKRLAPEGLDAQERSLAEAREDTVRLQGVAWLDNVRRHLQLPVKTFTTAVVYYHKFRLAHPKEDYQWIDAAAASLLTSCKNEDTLKKSRDILAAAYNMKLPSNQEQAATDDPMFETQSRMVIGIERLILESGGFDFRSRAPHHTLVKIGKSLPKSPDVKEVSQLAWTVLTDLHRTFAPLKQTSSTLALASLELAAHFTAAKSDDNSCIVRDNIQKLNLSTWHTTREEVMETLLDALDLYTHNTGSSILGSKYSLDDLLRIRLALNKECSDSSLPRYTVIQPPPSPDNANDTGNTLRVANGHPTPVSPPQPGAQAPQPVNAYTATSQHTPQTDGTLRFMLNPQRATEERAKVNRYYTEEWEEYEEEIDVPLPRDLSRERIRERDRDRDREGPSRRDRDSGRPRDFDHRRNADDRSNVDRRSARDSPRAAPPPREPKVARQSNPSNMLQSVVRAPSPAPEIIVQKDDDKDNQRDRDRGSDRPRDRPRSRDRDRRHDSDRRHDDRDRYESRRYRGSRDDRDRNSGGGSSRRHYDDDRRRNQR